MNNLFNNKYQDDILGTSSCFDRVILNGSITPISYLLGLGQFLSANNILLKDFLPYAKELAETQRESKIYCQRRRYTIYLFQQLEY